MKTVSSAQIDIESSVEEIESACTKRSFMKLPVEVDTDRLLQEFNNIPASAWGCSYWDVHCSIDMLLLRGGNKGTDEDFLTDEVTNSPILDQMPYIASLLNSEGPFGGTAYAFIFRTKPNGITRVHDDGHEVWKKTVRIHVPIITNKDAFLIAEEYAKHLEVGEVWTFDNQSQHSVVNGNETRVHLIFDVNPNPKLAELMLNATFDPGVHDPDRWAITLGPRSGGDRIPPLMFAIGDPLTADEKQSLGLNPAGFATRIARRSKKGMLLMSPVRANDIVTAVNGVDESVLSRTALDHIRLKHDPGEVIQLTVLRNGKEKTIPVTLRADNYFSPGARFAGVFERMGIHAGPKVKNEY